MASSNQCYDVVLTDGFSDDFNDDTTRGITSFDFDTNMVVMTFGSEKPDLGFVAHEFKHAYQFEVGELDLTDYSNEIPIFASKFTEEEANIRSAYFGSRTFTPKIN